MKYKNIVSVIVTAVLVLLTTSCPIPLESGNLSLLQDTDAPKIVITSPADYSEYATIIELLGYIEDNSLENLPDNTEILVLYNIPGTSTSGSVKVNTSDGTFSDIIDVSDLEGNQIIEFTTADVNGNSASKTVNFKKPQSGDISGFSVIPSNKQVKIDWDPVPGAEYYSLFESRYGLKVDRDEISGTSYTWPDLTNGEK